MSVTYPLSVIGQLVVPAATAATLSGDGDALAVSGLDVDGLVVDNARLVSTNGSITRFDNVTFQNFGEGVTQLTVNHPGTAAPFTFDNVTFDTTPSTGIYLSAIDNLADGNALTANLPGSTPTDGTSRESTSGGAIIKWDAELQPQPGNSWTGGAGDGLWSSAGNWSLGRVPNTTDTVYVNLDGTYTVSVDAPTTVYALEVGGTTGTQTLSISSQTLTVDSSITIGPTAALDMVSATMDGVGTITLASGSISSMYGSTINASIANNGTLVAQYTNTINGAYTSGSGSTLRVVGTSVGNGNLTIADGFTNNGAIELTNNYAGRASYLTVTAGTLVNAAGSTIEALAGAG